MTTPSAETMRTQLSDRLMAMVGLRQQYHETSRQLANLGVKVDSRSLWLASAMDEVATDYFEDLAREVRDACAKGTPATIEIKELVGEFLGKLRREANRDRLDHDLEAQKALVADLIAAGPFEAIEAALVEQSQTLETKGLQMVADNLIGDLGMNSNFIEPRAKGRHVILGKAAWRYDKYDLRKMVESIRKGLDFVSEKSGFEFGSALETLDSELEALGWEERIPSRTIIAKGSPLEVQCFKEKFEFRYSRPAFDAIVAYVALYGSEEKVDTAYNVSQLLAA